MRQEHEPTTGPDSIAPRGMRAPIQLASDWSMVVKSHSVPQPGLSRRGRAGEVHARAVPTANAPIVALKKKGEEVLSGRFNKSFASLFKTYRKMQPLFVAISLIFLPSFCCRKI